MPVQRRDIKGRKKYRVSHTGKSGGYVQVYDGADWSGSDPEVVDRVACLLGLISRSATSAVTAFHRLHTAVADALPALAGRALGRRGRVHAQVGPANPYVPLGKPLPCISIDTPSVHKSGCRSTESFAITCLPHLGTPVGCPSAGDPIDG